MKLKKKKMNKLEERKSKKFKEKRSLDGRTHGRLACTFCFFKLKSCVAASINKKERERERNTDVQAAHTVFLLFAG